MISNLEGVAILGLIDTLQSGRDVAVDGIAWLAQSIATGLALAFGVSIWRSGADLRSGSHRQKDHEMRSLLVRHEVNLDIIAMQQQCGHTRLAPTLLFDQSGDVLHMVRIWRGRMQFWVNEVTLLAQFLVSGFRYADLRRASGVARSSRMGTVGVPASVIYS